MSFSIIAATGLNGEIGSNNKLLWHIPEDFEWFKHHTYHKVCILGRKTYESIGKPLPKRINVVLTKDNSYNPHPNVIVRNNINDVLFEFSNEREVMVLGGSSIYKQFLPYCNRIYLTKVKHKFNADSYMPNINWDDWFKYFHREGSNQNGFNYEFNIYKKPLKE
ncbi:dihydrofolate reductase [Paraliobacillus ryukyuensis]|uniref:dihydrofolate reductase n=1 Tax=Paraliobacillus ryukyuensis TaxID=200904 RepID=UPI0009A89CEC|nr:dihydrofolate reductase [Paraliobacillus ryukyuensis]